MQSRIRNFCIISHIDHGKSTLADRLLELTGTVEQRKMQAQFLDTMELEREKGITIKLQPVRMRYGDYILNLIDTPGHVDFAYEVSRSLAAAEGALLLVDASQGIQAQTLANLYLARESGLVLGRDKTIIPVINKIDLGHAQTEKAVIEISRLLAVAPEKAIRISAKEGINIKQILEAIVERVSSPQGEKERPLRALIFDSDYDSYKGAIAYVRIVDGRLRAGDQVMMMAAGTRAEALEVGFFKPQMTKSETLETGEIGYLATGLKEVAHCRVGDTITLAVLPKGKTVVALPGYREPKPVVFASFYPTDADDYDGLKDALSKLRLNDAALRFEPESSEGLGRGFRCGFLGMLHLEIIAERIRREYRLDAIVTSPSVNYRVVTKAGTRLPVSSPADLPDAAAIETIEEPWVALEIVSPNQYLGYIMKLMEEVRGEYQNTEYLSAERVLLKYAAPLNEIVVDFYNRLKNATAGYASMGYEVLEHRRGDLVKVDVLVAGDKVDAFSRVLHRSKVYTESRALIGKLKQTIPQQLFAVSLQAAIDGKVIARETISAMRKDVTGYLYGGDYTRKRKLLEKQKRGKKKMRTLGRVNIPQEVFLEVLKK